MIETIKNLLAGTGTAAIGLSVFAIFFFAFLLAPTIAAVVVLLALFFWQLVRRR